MEIFAAMFIVVGMLFVFLTGAALIIMYAGPLMGMFILGVTLCLVGIVWGVLSR